MKLNTMTLDQIKADLLGQAVRWSSQAQGSATTKEGVVVYAGPDWRYRQREHHPRTTLLGEWRSPHDREEWLLADPRTRLIGGPRRQHESVSGIIVRVQRGKGAARFYAPSGSTELEVVAQEGEA